MKRATDILKKIEGHCKEQLNCSTRLRFHITENIQHLINEKASLEMRIKSVLEGMDVYDSKEYNLHTKPQSQR